MAHEERSAHLGRTLTIWKIRRYGKVNGVKVLVVFIGLMRLRVGFPLLLRTVLGHTRVAAKSLIGPRAIS
jgi:hypothetical protein